MMAYTYKFINSVRSFFDYRKAKTINYGINNILYDKNNVFNKYLQLSYGPLIKGEELEIPCAYYKEIREVLNKNTESSVKIIIPIHENGRETKITFSSALYSISESECIEVVVNNHKYYGGAGLILDEDFNPLLICTSLFEYIGGSYMIFIRYIVRISPKVFMRNDRTMEKGIINRLVPYLTNTKVNYSDYPCKVIVDDIDDFFAKPIKPNINHLNFNDILVEHTDEICNQWYYDY